MSQVNAATREAYQFSAEPKTVQSRSKYRDPNENRPSDYEEMQNDPRVRLNQGLNTMKTNSRKTTNPIGRTTEEENVPENNYVELSHRSHQGDASFKPYYRIDRPPTPEYKPLPPGVEVATQVEDYELFDFILEVEPILQVLVGKTLEQAQIELREEDERIEEARHKMRFEKQRNAELMVTQRKEALHIRKQEEKARREKQHIIEKEEKFIAHKKYISRLFAKHVTTDINTLSIRVLNGLGVLNFNLRTELKKDYIPYLISATLSKISHNSASAVEVQKVLEELQNHLHAGHARSVKIEQDRIKKIEDDKKAEQDRLIAEQKRRRERRRLLRLYCAKVDLLNKIQNLVMARPVEVDDVFAVDITDVFPTGKEQLATIGGLLGELWLILDSMQKEAKTTLTQEEIIHILAKLLNEKYKTKELVLYIDEQHQPIIQIVIDQMANDLIDFNQNKSANIQSLIEQLQNINCFQNLNTLVNSELLDRNIFQEINKALLYIYFTSVDYKIPEKKVEEPKEEAAESKPETNEGTQPEENAENTDNTGEQESKPAEDAEPKPAEEIEKATEGEVLPEAPVEEEFKLPDVTPFELELVEARKKIKLNFVPDWDFRRDCDGILRIRNPLNREVKPPTVTKIEKTGEGEQTGDEASAKAVTTTGEEMPVVEEDRDTMLRRLIATDDFIEPFTGSTFEQERENFPEQEVDYAQPARIYNTSIIQEAYLAQINECAQGKLRRELLKLIRETVSAYKDISDSRILEQAKEKYSENEKIILKDLLSDPEKIPIFDVENPQ